MKKILYLPFFLFILLFSCILIFTACDRHRPPDQTTDPSDTTTELPDVNLEPVEAVGLKYTVNADKKTCTVTGLGKCKDPLIIINKYIDGYKVTAIGASAFKNSASLISVTLPDSVESIGKYAFENCSLLSEVILPEGLLTIEKYAFENCESLSKMSLPETLTTIGAFAFKGCSELTEITIPASVTSVGKDIFNKASSLSTVYYNSAYGSSSNDFLNTKSIKKIVFGGEAIPEFICKKCENLEEIVIEDTVKSIGGGAFTLCTSLKEVAVPDSVVSIGYGAFSFCDELISITLPEKLTAISDSAFQNCASLANITIPDSVTSIGSEAFLGCSSLTSVKLPEKLTHMDIGAFRNCSALTDITIPDGIKAIPLETFKKCTELTSIIIPASVESIGEWAFSYTGLKTIYFDGTEEQWNAVKKAYGWNNGMRGYEILFENEDPETEDLCFSVGVNKIDTEKYGLKLSETVDADRSDSRLSTAIDQKITSLSVLDLPENLDMIDGEHNGKNYLAYTFYLQNAGEATVSYDYDLIISDTTENFDEAVRIRLYKDGEYVDYAKSKTDGMGSEPDTTEFQSTNTVTKCQVEEFKPGDTAKFTVVIWLESSDVDCADQIFEGFASFEMRISVMH